MAAIVWTDVEAHAPQLSTVPALAQDDILAHVNTTLKVDEFDGESGSKTRLARIYLAAHFGSLNQSGGAGGTGLAGPIKREQVGDIEREYSEATLTSTGSGSAGFELTSYGRSYLAIVRNSAARAWIVL